jgi:hypothetical protein
VNETLKKIVFVSVYKDYLYRNKPIFFTFYAQSTPICHLPAGAKRHDVTKKGRSKDVTSDNDCLCITYRYKL